MRDIEMIEDIQNKQIKNAGTINVLETIYKIGLILLVFLVFQHNDLQNERLNRLEFLIENAIVSEDKAFSIEIDDWKVFKRALMFVESSHKTDAVGTKDDVGVLQITPIYVREVNRIIGEQRYTLEDRFDIDKSLEMFEIMNQRYNPERCIIKAISIHNPKAPESYKRNVLREYSRLKRLSNE